MISAKAIETIITRSYDAIEEWYDINHADYEGESPHPTADCIYPEYLEN